MSAPTTSIDKVINGSAGAKVRSSVRTLEIVAGVTAVLTLLYWWNTRPRRRVAVAARRAQEREALTQEAREIYATALSGSSVFTDDTGQNPALISVNGNGESAAREELPLAARLPRALTNSSASTADVTAAEPGVEAVVTDEPRPPDRPNPRPMPRRTRSHMRARKVGGVDADQ